MFSILHLDMWTDKPIQDQITEPVLLQKQTE